MEVNFHLPGLRQNYPVNMLVLSMLKLKPDWFREGVRVASFFGEFPTSLWNGGRPSNYDQCDASFVQNVVKNINAQGVPVRYTYTNMLLTYEDLSDPYCNFCMQVADNGMNEVMVFSPVLEKYIRDKYPGYKLNSSTCKEIRDIAQVNEELEKDYYLVVLDYDLNHDESVLEAIAPQAGRVEILVNEVCYPGCAMRAEHYRQQSELQLAYDIHTGFPCPNQSTPRSFAECMERPAFITNEQIGGYIDRGFCNFKIAGRGMPQDYVEESYLYFLVKEEHRDFIRGKIDGLLAQFKAAQQGTGHKKFI